MEAKYKPESKIGSFFFLIFFKISKALLHYIMINVIYMED